MVESGELRFKVVKVEVAGQELIAAVGNLIVAQAAFDTSIALWPLAWIELRQGARVIDKTAHPTDNDGRRKEINKENSPAMPGCVFGNRESGLQCWRL